MIDFLVQSSIAEPTVVWLLFQSQKIGLNSKLNAHVICICATSEQCCILTLRQHQFYAL